MKKVVNVIIVTWNSAKTIQECLYSLRSFRQFINKVIVVDNASKDETVDVVRRFPWVNLIINKSNLGYGRAVNRAVRRSSGKFIFLINPDTEIQNGAGERLLVCLEGDNNIGVVGPKLIFPNQKIQKEMSHFPSLIPQILILIRLHRLPLLSNLVYPNYDYNKRQEADHLIGAAILMRKSVFEKVGGFDENFFMWFEDSDLLNRIKRAGFKIMYCPEAVVKHALGQSTAQLDYFKKQIIWNRSLRYYFKKHGSNLEQLILEPFIILSYIPAFLLLLKEKVNR